ncbi:hypothetical protein [Oceanobacillus profundus]|nr:hypothetical protein [Oceanobacillus profundus]MBR3121486.1 hypothetical protein [Oceanobacillus sp.]MCM3396516.1 hypothetical protein [Oceanobacillus profundus]MDO6451141.1 hypothetical protein [Oceanobacillus profundus]
MDFKSIAKKGAKAWKDMDTQKKDKLKQEITKRIKSESANKMIKKLFK